MDIGAITNGNTARKHRIRIAHAIAEKNGAEENIPLVCVVIRARVCVCACPRKRKKIENKGGRVRVWMMMMIEREDKSFFLFSLYSHTRARVIPSPLARSDDSNKRTRESQKSVACGSR